MELKDYSTEEIRMELKRRAKELKAKKDKVKRCRMCTHYGEVNYYGEPTVSNYERSISKCCQFFSWGNDNKYRKCHAPSQLACEHFEEIVND